MSRIRKLSRSSIGITGFAMFGLLMTAIACHWSLSARASVQDSARKDSGKVVVRGKMAATYQPETKIYNAAASTITVNSLEDGAPANDGKCTLREAMLNAEANNQSGSTDCVAGNGDDTINFSVTGIINLTTGLPITFSSFSIAGPGPDLLTVRGADFSEKSVFRFRSGSTINLKTVSVSGLKITNGYAKFNDSEGGAIYNDFVLLSVDNCDISGNVAFRGGGIYSNSGTVTITRSTISNNTADDGGGIYTHAAQVTIVESTISGNKAGDRGGGIKYGDICCLNRNLVITNSTISGNQASRGSAIEFNRLTMLLTNCTITNNSTTTSTDGAISMTSPFDPSQTISTQLKNTLVVGNTGRNFATAATASFISMGNNLDSDGTSGFVNNNGNLVGTIAAPIDAKLGPLANNGGPTQTHALLPGSPAINTGTAAGAPSTDQRGVSRPFGGGVDIGAFELVPPMVVNSLADGAPANNGQCTLREALINANNNNQSGSTDCVAGSGPDTITFGVNGTINLTSALPNITDSLHIAGSGANQLTVRRDTGGDYRIFTIGSGNTVGIAGLTITGGSLPASEGGGILNAGSLTLTDCAVTGNYANGGGGIMNNGSLTMTGCTISRNTSNFDGGGLYNLGNATANLINCTFSGNVGTSSGIATGAGSGQTATTLLTNCTLSAHSMGDAVIKNIDFGGGLNVKTQLRNTLVAGNEVVNFAIGAGTTLTSLGGNFDSDGSSGFTDGIVGTAQFKLDPKLGPLANNGGPTQTHALLRGSPAIDAGVNSQAPATDQRGLTREKDGNGDGLVAVDIGAYELSYRFVNVATGNDNNSGLTPTSPHKTVAHAITVAGDGEILILAAGTYPENNLMITKTLSFEGAGAGQTIIDGQQLKRVFSITQSGLNIGFSKLTIRGGKAPASGDDYDGGGIMSASDLTLTDCALINNEARQVGGAVYLYLAKGTFTGCTFSGNKAGLGGGAIVLLANTGNVLQLINSTVSGNTALGQGAGGGVLNVPGGTLEVVNSTIADNTGAAAAGIYTATSASITTATTRLRNSILANANANLQKGVIGNDDVFTAGGPATITSLGNNLVSDGGGGFLTASGDQINKDPKLSPLANNGGPTQTHLLLCGSPAINAGSNTGAPGTDQRGVARPQGGTVDIGAVEGDYSLSIVQTPLQNGKVGVAYSAGIYVTPTTTPLPLIFTATTPLPAGLRLDLDPFGYPIITGTPTAAVSNFGFTLMAVSLLETGKQGCFDYTITVDPACPAITINPATLLAGQLGQQYNQQLTQTGGTGAITWSKTGDLPGNVSLNPATGLLSGAPTASGTFNFSVTATDANGCASAPKAYSLVIAQCPAITINPATLPGGQIGLQYSQQLTQTGGTGTLMWSFAGGLPTGVTMDLTTGLISGKPTVSGTFNFSLSFCKTRDERAKFEFSR